MITASPTKPQKSNEWYTPATYIEAAREVIGSIDLDPASCALANETVKATRYFTADDDGLSKAWKGRVWLNPPYSREGALRGMEPGPHESVVKLWINRLISEYHRSNVSQAILLIKADPKEQWFQPCWEFPICFAAHRILFDRPGLPPEKHQFGTAFVYLGPNESQFINVFSQFGTVARRISPRS